MKQQSPAGVPGRFSALLLLLLALVVLAGFAAAPYLWQRSLAVQLRADRAELATLSQQAGRGALMRDRKAVLRGSDLMHKVLLVGPTAGIASANLQDLVVRHVNDSRITLRSIEALEPADDGDHLRIDVRLSVQASTPALTDFLHEVEAGLPLLVVDDVSLRSRVPPQGSRGPVLLDASLRISGYTLKSVSP